MSGNLPTAGRESVKEGHLGGYFHGGDEGTWCPRLWTRLVEEFEVRSVLDVGCGEGHSTRFFQGLGCEVLGVEGSQEALANSVLPEQMARHDFRDGPFTTDRDFDMVWSCEFVEHVEPEFVANVLRTLGLARKVVAMTHAFPGQHGHHHVNLRPNRYWIRLIEARGFDLDIERTLATRRLSLDDHPSINHFARSGLIFLRGGGAHAAAEREPVGRSVKDHVGAALKSARVSWRFKTSTPYREQQRRRKARKRARKQARANPA